MNELKKNYLKKLARVLSIEETIIEHIPMMITQASNEELIEALSEHLEEAKDQRNRLVEILSVAGSATVQEPDKAFIMMVESSAREIEQVKDNDVRDALIIASSQVVEHIEIAHYATLVLWAEELGEEEASGMLRETLDEEVSADERLSAIAESGPFATGVNDET